MLSAIREMFLFKSKDIKDLILVDNKPPVYELPKNIRSYYIPCITILPDPLEQPKEDERNCRNCGANDYLVKDYTKKCSYCGTIT